MIIVGAFFSSPGGDAAAGGAGSEKKIDIRILCSTVY